MIRIGLTGTIGAGKSTVGHLFEGWGAARLDADQLAREVVLPGSDGLDAIATTWGAGLLSEDGTLDRAALGEIVFADPAEREKLEAILHPAINRLRRERADEADEAGAAILVAEVPLLLEKDLGGEYDFVVVIDAAEDLSSDDKSEARAILEEADPVLARIKKDNQRCIKG